MKHSTEFIWNQVDYVLDNCKKHNITTPSRADTKLSSFISELMNWNKRFNLVSTGDLNIVGQRHILDSLSPLAYFSPAKNCKLLDIGSGAGFPAIPLKLFRPDIDMTLVEAKRKKSLFLKACASFLGFDNYRVEWSRIEDIKPNADYDIVTSRATMAPAKMAKVAIDYIKPGGKIILFIGPSEFQKIDLLKSTFYKLGYSLLLSRKSPFTDKDLHLLLGMKSK
ncbi:MAG: 16S rRNA (guanine(527)-N(7))-methyltransferase RsmG [Candidatus Zixiibacteriota bacterium]